MEGLTGPVVVIAAVLVLAGAQKASRPDDTAGALRALHLPSHFTLVRALGGTEVVVGVAAIITFLPAVLALAAALYLGFAAFVAAALRAGTAVQSCGCFGRADTPPTALHLVSNVVAAGTLIAAAATRTPGVGTVVPDQPWSAVPFFVLLAVCTYEYVAILTVVPARHATPRSGPSA